jgi:hypothetical protein
MARAHASQLGPTRGTAPEGVGPGTADRSDVGRQRCAGSILVVRFDALDGVVQTLCQSVEEAGDSRKRVAALSRDVTGWIPRLVSLPEGDKHQ